MFIETKKLSFIHTRISKLGITHAYSRIKTIAVFQCDNCNNMFDRNLGDMDHRRISNRYFHVCSNCNAKQFAQKKGVERRQIWNLPANSDIDISRI